MIIKVTNLKALHFALSLAEHFLKEVKVCNQYRDQNHVYFSKEGTLYASDGLTIICAKKAFEPIEKSIALKMIKPNEIKYKKLESMEIDTDIYNEISSDKIVNYEKVLTGNVKEFNFDITKWGNSETFDTAVLGSSTQWIFGIDYIGKTGREEQCFYACNCNKKNIHYLFNHGIPNTYIFSMPLKPNDLGYMIEKNINNFKLFPLNENEIITTPIKKKLPMPIIPSIPVPLKKKVKFVLSEDEKFILKFITEKSKHIDELIKESKISIGRISSLLGTLEFKDLIVREIGMRFKLK